MPERTYVRDVMEPMTRAIRVTQTIVAARQRMQGDMRVKSLIVVDDNDRPIGAVRYNEVSTAAAGGTVADVMTSNIPTISADQSLEDVTGLMTEHDVDRLAVVDSNGEVVGELTRSALTRSETHGDSASTGESLSDAVAGRETPVYRVARDMSVIGSAGGNVGKVRDILSDTLTGELTHIVIHTGLIFGRDKSVPADLIENVTDNEVRLKVNKSEIEALPDLEKSE